MIFIVHSIAMNEIKRWWDWPAGLMVVFLVGVTAARLSVTNWSPNLWMLDILAVAGVTLGLLLGASRFRPRTVFWLGAAYSLFFIFWQLGMIIGDDLQWNGRLSLLFQRLGDTFTLFVRNIPVTDPLLFLAIMGLLVWVISMTAGYRVARYGKPWWPIVVLSILLIVVDYYHPFLQHRNRYSALFFLLLLLLLGRLFLLKLREKWKQNAVMEDSETGLNLAKWTAILSLVLIVGAWNLPIVIQGLTPGSPVQRRWDQSWRVVRDRLSNAVAGLTNPVVKVSDLYGSSITLGQRAATGDELIFQIQVPDTTRAQETRYYWKAMTYDRYGRDGWGNSEADILLNPANDWRISSETYESQIALSLNVTSLLPLSRTIVAAGTPLNFSVPVSVRTAPAENDDLDILGLAAEPPLSAGATYRMQVRLADPTAKQLQESGEEYPDWIQERYLALPEDFSQRIQSLAEEVTAGEDDPYGKAVKITNFLRRTISYTEEMERPPAGADVMEWFLFDYQQGFCNYYASAEVLMLRAVGVPARLAVGFAAGEFNEETSTFTVRRKDSHAWPEVYFVGAGWVEFEPTTAQAARNFPEERNSPGNQPLGPNLPPPIIMDGGELPEPEGTLTPKAPGERQKYVPIGTTLAWLLVIFFAIAIPAIFFLRFMPEGEGGSLWVRLENFLKKHGRPVPTWLRGLASGRDRQRMLQAMSWINRVLAGMGEKVEEGKTAGERIGLLIGHIPEAEGPAGILLHEYQLAEYSLASVDYESAFAAGKEIIRLYVKRKIKRILGIKN